MKPKYTLKQLVFYIKDNKIHSSCITSIVIINNAHDDFANTQSQQDMYAPLGKSRIEYYILDEKFLEDQLFASRNELSEFLCKATLNEILPQKIFEYDGDDLENYTIHKHGKPYLELFSNEDDAITLTDLLNNNQGRFEA